MGRLDQDKAAQLMRADPRRDVYEGGDARGRGCGQFFVTYSDGGSPTLTKADVAQMVRDGLLAPHPTGCDGWFVRGPKL